MEPAIFEAVADAAARLVRGAVVLGARFSAGPHTPAVPAAHAWAVLDLQGAPLALAHDAFEAARMFVLAEEGRLGDTSAGPIRMETDAQAAAWAFLDRCDDHAHAYGAVIDARRALAGPCPTCDDSGAVGHAGSFDACPEGCLGTGTGGAL